MIPEVLVNTNLFVDGISFSGDVPSMTLPKIVVKTDEYRGGGMGGSIEMDMGLEKMEAGFVTTGVRRESMKFVGLADQTACNTVFRGPSRAKKVVLPRLLRQSAACSKSWIWATGKPVKRPS